MSDPDDILAEFDDEESVEAEVDMSTLPAAIADPSMQEANVLNPNTGLTEKAPLDSRITRWRLIPMPVREKAFFMWVEFGDYVTVASKLGMKVSQVRSLSARDKWEDRAAELRVGLEKSLGSLYLEKQREATRFALALLNEMDPARVAKLLEGKDVVRLILGLATEGKAASSGLTVKTDGGPAQVNVNPGPDGSTSAYAGLSDVELARLAREKGIDVQAAPQVLDRPPPSLPDADSGGQS